MTHPTVIAAPRRRVLTYDALRTFAILSVVAIHCFIPLRDLLPAKAPARVVDDLLHYAVPVFVFISGALVWGRHRAGGRAAFLRFAHGRIQTVALPYLAWATVYLGITLLRSANPLSVVARAPGMLLVGSVWYHLYFIPMLLGFYLLTPIASPLIRRWPEASLLAVFALRVLAWPEIAPWLQETAPEMVWSYVNHFATHLPHMVLGAWFAVRTPSPTLTVRRVWPLLVGGGTAVLLARSVGMFDAWRDTLASYLVYPLGMTATVLGLAFAAFWLEPHYDRFEHELVGGAALSFGVYFIHPLVLLGLWSGADAVGATRVWLQWWSLPAAWIIVSAASYGAAWALSRSHRTSWLVGIRAGAGG